MAEIVGRRRIGAPEAKNRGVLLDAAEQLLLDEGYASVTSRRVAEKAGLKPQLVHYYFRTMEDLFLAVFRRMAEAGLSVLTAALASPQPLWSLWRFSTQPEATRLTMEFMGLANHRKELRAEIVYYAERFREEQNAAIAAALTRYGVASDDVPPVVWTVFATSVSQGLVMERALGMTTGHAETFAYCEHWIRRLEGEPLSGGQERSDPGIGRGGQERSDPGIGRGGQERSDPGIGPVDDAS